ncbi:hypothetical protein Tco_1364215 [Tanacetum coccineum]
MNTYSGHLALYLFGWCLLVISVVGADIALFALSILAVSPALLNYGALSILVVSLAICSSSIVEGRVPSRTWAAQMKSPEADSATQLVERNLKSDVDVVPCFVALCPPVVMEILDGFLYLLLENHVILSLFRVCALICFLLVNLMIPWFSELYSDLVPIGESCDSLMSVPISFIVESSDSQCIQSLYSDFSFIVESSDSQCIQSLYSVFYLVGESCDSQLI